MAVGGAVAESLYALLAFWGLSTVLASHPLVLPASRLVGSVLLLAIGLVMLLARPKGATPQTQPPRRGAKRSLALGFLITAVNPTLIITWTAAVAAVHATGLLAMRRDQALPFAAAVCAGIIAWFATLLWMVATGGTGWASGPWAGSGRPWGPCWWRWACGWPCGPPSGGDQRRPPVPFT